MLTEQVQTMLENDRQVGAQLVEKWSRMPGNRLRGYSNLKEVNFMEGLEHKQDAAMMVASLYENALKQLRSLDETTRMLQVGSFEKFVFPIIRAVFANLVASEWVTTQALTAPTGLVFFMDAIYGTQKGNINRGDKVFDALTGPSTDTHYTDEVVSEEAIGTGDGATANYTGNLAHIPVRPGTVRITDGTQVVVDNGNGALVGDVNALGTNTINYATGAYDVTFTANVVNATAITASYEYNLEANADIPEMDLILTSAPVTARPHKLRARWSIEAQQDFQAYHGINAEVELVAFMANEISKEINYKIRAHLQSIAAAGSVTWDRTPDTGVPWIWHKESLYDAFVQASNFIFAATQRREATYFICGVNVCNVVETLSKFKSAGNNAKAAAGVRKIGTLGEFTIYKDPTMDADSFVGGFKGSNFLDTGYIYAPYQGLYTTQLIVLDDMIARKAMAQRVGLKVVNPNFYVTGSVTQSGGAFVA